MRKFSRCNLQRIDQCWELDMSRMDHRNGRVVDAASRDSGVRGRGGPALISVVGQSRHYWGARFWYYRGHASRNPCRNCGIVSTMKTQYRVACARPIVKSRHRRFIRPKGHGLRNEFKVGNIVKNKDQIKIKSYIR